MRIVNRVVDFITSRKRRGMTPNETLAYNRQCLLAVEAHRHRGTPLSLAAFHYGVTPADVWSLHILLEKYQPVLVEHAQLLRDGQVVPGYMLHRHGRREDIEQMDKARPWRWRPRRDRVAPLAC